MSSCISLCIILFVVIVGRGIRPSSTSVAMSAQAGCIVRRCSSLCSELPVVVSFATMADLREKLEAIRRQKLSLADWERALIAEGIAFHEMEEATLKFERTLFRAANTDDKDYIKELAMKKRAKAADRQLRQTEAAALSTVATAHTATEIRPGDAAAGSSTGIASASDSKKPDEKNLEDSNNMEDSLSSSSASSSSGSCTATPAKTQRGEE